MNYQIKKNDCSNLEELITLSKSYYSTGDIIDKRYLEWQYLKNPYGLPFLFTSKDTLTDQLAGQYLVIPLEYQISGEKLAGSLSLNTLTHPDHQGKGLFTKMAKATYADCEASNNNFTIGFPNPLSYPGFVKKLNFSHLGDIPLLIKPLKPINILRSYFQKEKEKHGGEIILEQVSSKKNIHQLDFHNQTDENKYNAFWNKIMSNYPISANKDFKFLKWRYNDHPTKKYKVYYIENNGEIDGVIILRAEHVWGFKVGLIMDFMTNEPSKNSKFLLKHASKIFKNLKLDFITALHTPIKEYNILKKNNFYKIPQKLLPQKIHFIVRSNKKFNNEEMILKLENWKLTFGDYDIF